MKKLSIKEAKSHFQQLAGKDVYFVNIMQPASMVASLWDDLDNKDAVKPVWHKKQNLKVVEHSKFLELNDSRLDLEDEFFIHNNLLINEYQKDWCLVYYGGER